MSHHHKRDYASLFKERNLNSIVIRRKIEKWLKIALIVLAIIMVIAVVVVYRLG